MDWHTLSVDEALGKLGSSCDGLRSDEARDRLRKHGPNAIEEARRRTPLAMLLGQFTDFMILVLIAAAVVSGLIGDLTDTIAILVIVVLNAVIGFVQEYRAEKAMEALKRMAAPYATVRRDGSQKEVAAAELVPGDIVVLEAGRILPADLRVIEAEQLKTGEAAITGESLPVVKTSEPMAQENLSVGDRRNMVFKGTGVVHGRGAGVVTATGMETELGKIAELLQGENEVKTPLQKRLAAFSSKLALIVLVICAVFFTVGILRGAPEGYNVAIEGPYWVRILLTAISLAVAAIPEALPAVVTISLALGARKLVAQHALVRKLPAVETLGSITYICSDKTGTLTLNRMTVEEVFVDGHGSDAGAFHPSTGQHDAPSLFAASLALSTDVTTDQNGDAKGDPTEIALFEFARAKGYDKGQLERTMGRVAEVPFDSERKLMTTVHNFPGNRGAPFVAFTKGAPDVLVERCSGTFDGPRVGPLDRQAVIEANEKMSRRGLRVLAVALKFLEQVPDPIDSETVERDLMFVGLAGMIDPPREEARDAVATCKKAGISPVMITGDHPGTATAIAERLGIMESPDDLVVSGTELAAMPLDQFEREVEHVKVYARVAPAQKLKVLKALQAKGQFAAMTGDGVNDAPALKRADIGIAMGITGTDVTKEAAHMILLDDNFATIVNAVREGRRIYDNIRKFIRYTMTSNAGEIWAIFLAPLVGLPVPLLPIHILWINLLTDGLPGLALSVEPAEKGLMDRPPRHPRESIFAHRMGAQIVWVGLVMGMISLVPEWWSISGHSFLGFEITNWRTMVFTVLCFSQMGNVLAIKSERQSFFSQGFLSNKSLLAAFLLTVVLQMATIYLPGLNKVFSTSPLTPVELAISILLSSVVFFGVELEKLIRRALRNRPKEH